jgi:hypothetical protein
MDDLPVDVLIWRFLGHKICKSAILSPQRLWNTWGPNLQLLISQQARLAHPHARPNAIISRQPRDAHANANANANPQASTLTCGHFVRGSTGQQPLQA